MTEWDEIYNQGKQLNQWPFSDIVSLTKRHMPDLDGRRVLELGSGAGGNAIFFFTNGANYTGMDSSHAVCGGLILHGDFTDSLPLRDCDLIFDRAAVTHNDTESIQRCLELAHEALKPGGLYIGVDWFSDFHSDHKKGEAVDEFTRTNIPAGQFAGVGKVHFSSYRHLVELFVGYDVIEIQGKTVHNIKPKVGIVGCVGTWNIVARKPE